MQFQLKMPDLATNDSPLRLVRWIVQPGEIVTRGQPLLEAETDKATLEVEAALGGRLDQVLCQAGEQVSVGQVIAILEIAETAPSATSTGSPPRLQEAPQAVVPPVSAAPAGGDLAEPSAQKPVGMFARNRAASDSASAAAGFSLSVAQRTAAQRLQTSKQTIPHFYLQTSFNAAAIMARRQAAEPRKPAWDAFFVLAVAKAIRRFDRFSSRWDGARLIPAGSDAIGVAIDMEDELFVIPVHAPGGKTVAEISDEIRRGAEGLRSGDQEVRRIHPALMTVTNLGICNVEQFVPIINPPEAAILGVGKVRPTPVARDNGELAVQPRGTLTLSVDHRVASGKYAARFLEAIVAELEAM